MTTGRGSIRLLAGVTAVVGAGTLVQPRRVAGWFSRPGRVPDSAVVRVLGGRQLVQGAAQITRPTTEAVLIGVVVDVLHLASMLVLGAVWPTYRRPALSSAAITGILAGAGVAVIFFEKGYVQ